MTGRIGNRWLRTFAAVSLLGLISVSCAQEVGDIDRTSPNKLKKSALAGSWYYLQTMIDVPQQSGQGFIGNTNFGNSAKVMFDVTEKFVYVLPVQETVQFAEKPYTQRKIRNYWDAGKSHEFVELFAGQPLAAFPCTHFDVVRDYNPSTGDQSNTLTENTTDRVWHEREYIRVDWGGTAVQDWSFPVGTSKFSPVDHYVEESTDPFLRPTGAGENPDKPEFKDGYISFVTKAYIAPAEANWQGYVCDPYGLSNTDCAGSVIKVRSSFKHAEVTPDYETFTYTNAEHMNKFGFFLAERYAYDELWDLRESARDYKAQRWNLWKTTWTYEDIVGSDGKPVQTACMDNEDCTSDGVVLDYSGTRCVKESFYKPGVCKKATLKPLKDRGLKPIIYHLSNTLPLEPGDRMRKQFYKSADEWSQAFKDAVAWGYALEEKGQYWTKACSANTDCTAGRADIQADLTIAMPRQDKTDGKGVACSATTPCAANQFCKSDVCFWADGSGQSGQVLEPKLVKGTRRATFVIGKSGGKTVVVPVKEDQSGVTGAAVRFVNLTADSQSLSIKGATLTNAYADGAWVTEAASVIAGAVDLTVGAATKSETLQNGWDYVVVYTGDALVVAGTKRNSSVEGVRFLNAISGGAGVDGTVNAIRAAQDLRFESISEYVPQAFDEARVVVLNSGARGDVTCYFTQHEGRCTGYASTWTDADDTRVTEIKSALPDMFVLCENEYHMSTEAQDFADAQELKDVYTDRSLTFSKGEAIPSAKALTNGRYSVKGKNPYNLAAEQNLSDANAIFNPCKDFVSEPESIKKVGDIRYNIIYWVAENQAASPLGYGPSAGDPETGELVFGSAYIYGAPTLTYGQMSADLVDMVNGQITTDDVITGRYVRDFVERKGDVLPSDNSATLYEGGLEARDSAEASLLGSTQLSAQFDQQGVMHPATDPLKIPELLKFATDKNYRKQLYQTLPTVPSNYSQTRIDAIRGTPLEEMMINSEVRLGLTGKIDASPLTPAQRKSFSPAAWGTAHAALHAVGRDRDNRMAKGPCTYDREFMDDNIYGLAKEFFCTDAELAQYQADPTSVPGKSCLTGDDLRWEITSRILSGLVEHEVGHTMGLRHNFSGSNDLFNYRDEYYTVREKENVYCQTDGHCDEDVQESCKFTTCSTGTPCPNGTTCNAGKCLDGAAIETGLCATLDGKPVVKLAPHPVNTEQEKLHKMPEYQYSTVMDYGATFNTDVHGLGKYDYAAMKFGYLKMVDTYADTSKLTARVATVAKNAGTDPSNVAYFLDTSNWRDSGILFSPFYYLENYIGVEQNLKRRPASYEQVKLEHAMETNYDSGELYWTYIEVPYRFCSDEFNGNLGCYTWDAGVDPGEMVNTAIGKLDEYYIMDAFMRESLFKGSSSFMNSYYNRLLSRYMNILADAGRYFAIYDNIFRTRSWYKDFSTNVYQLGTLANASRAAFNELAEILASPAPGAFQKGADGVYRNVSYDEQASADLNIPVGVGRYPYTQFMSSETYNFDLHVLFVGSFWSKLAALVTLTDSSFTSASDFVGEQLPVGRSTSVGFNTLYQREMTNLLGGIISESLDAYSGVVDVDPQGKRVFRSRDLFDLNGEPGKDMIEPGLNNLTMKLYASLYGMANLPAGFDPSFTDAMAVFVEGNGEEYNLNQVGAGVDVAEFKDPFGGKTYKAYTPNYDTGRVAPAYTIVKRAQATREKWEAANPASALKTDYERQLKKDIETLDVLRSFHQTFGTLTY